MYLNYAVLILLVHKINWVCSLYQLRHDNANMETERENIYVKYTTRDNLLWQMSSSRALRLRIKLLKTLHRLLFIYILYFKLIMNILLLSVNND